MSLTNPTGEQYVRLRGALRRARGVMARDLPWTGSSPWGVFVSETMLQQTPVSRVIRYWESFVTAYPSPSDAARAPVGEILEGWRGLGYPRRALRLREAATIMVDEYGGRVPDSLESLRRLPGVGEYTASAVASFAFSRRVPVIDTNVGRVLARALANRSLRPAEARLEASRLLPRDDVGAFNQSLLDLGAQWCRPQPRCEECPVRRVCAWREAGGDDPATTSAFVSRPQARFEGSERQRRGLVLGSLESAPLSFELLAQRTGLQRSDLERVVGALVREGFCTLGEDGVAWPTERSR